MKKHTNHVAQGQLGVHRVISELIARGHEPYLPVVDNGIDILLRSGIRLQIKTTRRETQHWRSVGSWSFSLSIQSVGAQHRYTSKTRKFSEQVDFVILHAVEAARFWVVPAAVLDGRNTVCFKDGRKQWKDLDEVEINRLRMDGYTLEAIAGRFGVSMKTVRRRLTTNQKPRRRFADVAQYENRWDLITGTNDVLNEATELVTQTPHDAGMNTTAEGTVSRTGKD